MEEKDVTYNLFKDDSGEINITSNIDDCKDYLSVAETVALATKCIGDVYSSILDDLYKDERDEEDTLELIYCITINLIQAVVNIGYNSSNILVGRKPEVLECSTCVYNAEKSIDNVNLYKPIGSLHSGDLNILDPLQAGTAFFADVIEALMEFKSADEVKSIINMSLEVIKKDCNNIIENIGA